MFTNSEMLREQHNEKFGLLCPDSPFALMQGICPACSLIKWKRVFNSGFFCHYLFQSDFRYDSVW